MDIIKNDTNLLDLIKFLQKEIINRKWAEKKANDALDYAESIIDSVQSPLIVLDDEYKIVSANLPFHELFGLGAEVCIGKRFFELKDGIFDLPELKRHVVADKHSQDAIQVTQNFSLLGVKHLEIKIVDLQYNIKHLKFKLLIINDITGMIDAQKLLEKTLSEKQFLLTEIEHRIRNNLFVIEGLLDLELQTISDAGAKVAFEKTISRVHSIGTLYEKMYHAKNEGKLAFKQYLAELVEGIRRLFDNGIPISFTFSGDDFIIDGSTMYSISLIVNELVTNSMKHAFQGMAAGEITIDSRKSAQKVSIVFRDNGRGATGSASGTDSFGQTLIRMLAEQIQATITFPPSKGFACGIEFTVAD